MAKKYGHQVDKKGKVKVVQEKDGRGARKSAGGSHGDFQKDGVGSRITDAILRKMGK